MYLTCVPKKTVFPTDMYKLTMASAGYPLRNEVFYYAHRRGGRHFMPLDVPAYVKKLRPDLNKKDVLGHQAFDKDALEVFAVPQGCWFYDKEPAVVVRGPSAYASWLEPLLLMINHSIQIATLARQGMLPKTLKVTCPEEEEIVRQALDAANYSKQVKIVVCEGEYLKSVYDRAKALVEAVECPDNLFEVGLRAATCPKQHTLALYEAQTAGFTKTSNTAATHFGMTAVGTMGHEHPQRFFSDYEAFRAMRDRTPGFLFYLPDTYDTRRSGLPAIIKVLQEDRSREAGVRFDDDDMEGTYRYAVDLFRRNGLEPHIALESGWNLEKTVQFEALRKELGWPAEKQHYGIGGYLINPPWPTVTRDTVQAVYKLACTGGEPVMKFGEEYSFKNLTKGSGKASLPGDLVLLTSSDKRIVACKGEKDIPKEFVPITQIDAGHISNATSEVLPLFLSNEVKQAVRNCSDRRPQGITHAVNGAVL